MRITSKQNYNKRHFNAGQNRLRALTVAALLAAGALALTPGSAQAQFVCDSDAAGESGAGATAANSVSNVACGTNANASGAGSFNLAIGTAADASGTNGSNTATGASANASGIGSSNTATGLFANASGNNSLNIATGRSADASGGVSNNIATGRTANASGSISNNIAIGLLANASGTSTSNVAIGTFSVSTGGLSTAVGPSASAAFANAAAFGNGATATRANQQVFGTAANSYTTPGITSAASTAAQGAVQGLVTTDANGNLASDGGVLQAQVNALSASSAGTAINTAAIDANRNDISENREGVAMALAVAGTLSLPAGKNFALTGNWGTFEGDNAIGFSGTARISKNVYFNAGFGAGLSRGTTGGRAGFSVLW